MLDGSPKFDPASSPTTLREEASRITAFAPQPFGGTPPGTN